MNVLDIFYTINSINILSILEVVDKEVSKRQVSRTTSARKRWRAILIET